MKNNYLNSIEQAENVFYEYQKINQKPYSFDDEIDFIWNLLTKEYQAKILEYAKQSKKLVDENCGKIKLSVDEKNNAIKYLEWAIEENVAGAHIPNYAK